MFSIIIPVGPGRDAQEALSSLLTAGIDASDEVIVVGDGHSLQLDEAFNSLSIILTATAEPKGANAARNLGASMASGDILCFLDDDDQYERNALVQLKSVISKNPISNVWSLGWCFLSERRSRSGRRPSQLCEQNIWKRNIAGGCSSMVLRKSIFVECGGFDESMASMQDWDYWLRLSRMTPISTVQGSAIIYNDSESPRISTNQTARISGLTRLLEKNASHWPKPVIAFHQARLAAVKFRTGTASWWSIFQIHAPLESSLFALRELFAISHPPSAIIN
jgi:glycosyltransferase involved in cell wall biosynthesis